MRALLSILLCFAGYWTAYAGRMPLGGETLDFWDKRSVVVVRVTDVERDRNGFAIHATLLDTLASPAPIRDSKLRLGWTTGGVSELGFIPKQGEVLLLCIESGKDSGWVVPGFILNFFDSKSCAMKIEDADDPKVERMRKKIAELQEFARKLAETQAAERAQRHKEWKEQHDKYNEQRRKEQLERYDAAFKRDQKLREEAEKKKSSP